MVPEIVVLGAKIATDIGIVTAVGCVSKRLTAPFALNTVQKIGIFCAEIAVAGMIAEKTDVYIEDTFETMEEFLAKRNSGDNWTKGARVHGK